MELVKGVPITEYCDRCKLTLKQRLELFVPVCQAIQHAHQKGIIHRDIKPNNVLVALYDDKPVVKVIDFGVAKATSGALTERTLETGFGAVVGTPQYMSPEQATFNNLDIDTRSDVYALGVLLYELLTGAPPFAQLDLEKRGLLEMLRVVREEEPPRPSLLKDEGGRMKDESRTTRRGWPFSSFILHPSAFPEELDWIVMKALEKDRTRRYESADGFAADVQRYLSGEAVQARPPSTAYRLKKFVRRHKGQVLAASLVVCALLAGLAGTAWQAIRAERARAEEANQRAVAEANERKANAAADGERRARLDAQEKERLAVAAAAKERTARREEERQRKYAEAISRFVKDDFLALTSAEGQARFGGEGREALTHDTTLRELLDRAAQKLRARKDLDPRIEAELCWIIGVNYRGAGEAQKGLEFLERAVQLRTKLLGRDQDDTLEAMNSLGLAYAVAGKHDQAVPLLEETLQRRKAGFGPNHPSTLTAMNNLAAAYRAAGRRDRVLPLLEETLQRHQARLGPDHPHTLTAMNNLALAYWNAGQRDRALPLLEQALPLMKARLGPDHPHTFTTMSNLALAYQDAGKHDRAVPLLEEALQLHKAKLGSDHPDTLTTMKHLAVAYEAAGKRDRAVPLFEQTVQLMKVKLGPDHPDTLTTMNYLAVAYWSGKQLDKSIPLFEETLRLGEKKLGRHDPQTLQIVANLGVNYLDAGRLPEALPLLEEAYQASRQHAPLRWVAARLQDSYRKAGANAKLADLLLEQLAETRKTLPKDSPQLGGVLATIGLILLQQKRWAEAEPLLRECLAIRSKAQPDSWMTFQARSMLGGALLGQKRYADAEPLLREGYEGLKQREKSIPAPAANRIPAALDRLIELYTATNQPDEAKKWQAERAKYPAAQAPPSPERK